MENRYIELKASKSIPEAGEGSFAKEDIPPNTIYALYGGLILNKSDIDEYTIERNKVYKANKWTKIHPQVIDDWKYRYIIGFILISKNLFVLECPISHLDYNFVYFIVKTSLH